jgi:hypothetical protein
MMLGRHGVLAGRLFRNEFDPIADIVGCFGVGELGMSCGDVGQCECDDLIITSGAGDIAAVASDLPEHENSSQHTSEAVRTRICASSVSSPQGFPKVSPTLRQRRHNYARECLNRDNNKQTNQRPVSY